MKCKIITRTNLWSEVYCHAGVEFLIIKYEREHTGLVRIRSSRIKISHFHNLTYFLTRLSYTHHPFQDSQAHSNPRNYQWNTRPECVFTDIISDIGGKQTNRIVVHLGAAVECHTMDCEGKNAGLVRIRSAKNIKLIKYYTNNFSFIWMTLKYLKKGLVWIRPSRIKISHFRNLTYFLTQLSHTHHLLQGSQAHSNPRKYQ